MAIKLAHLLKQSSAYLARVGCLIHYISRVEIKSGKGSLLHLKTTLEGTMLIMVYYTVWGKGLGDMGSRFVSMEEALYWAIADSRLYQELMDLLDYQFLKINFVDKPLGRFATDSPLD